MNWFLKLVFLLSFLFVIACVHKESLNYRLNIFLKTLDNKQVVKDFKNGNLDPVAKYIESQSTQDKEFLFKIDKIKKEEGIYFFNSKELTKFFYNFFYQTNN